MSISFAAHLPDQRPVTALGFNAPLSVPKWIRIRHDFVPRLESLWILTIL
jgi:hypothetical protein